jgi:cell division topological specificity factor
MHIISDCKQWWNRLCRRADVADSAQNAKERLKIVVSHQRACESAPEFILQMRQELIAVIGKYVAVDMQHINVNVQQEGKNSVLELNILIPDVKTV